MRVEILTSIAGIRGALEPGQVVDLDEQRAGRLLSAGYAKKAETATRKAPEKATKGRK